MAASKALAVFMSVVLAVGLMPSFIAWGIPVTSNDFSQTQDAADIADTPDAEDDEASQSPEDDDGVVLLSEEDPKAPDDELGAEGTGQLTSNQSGLGDELNGNGGEATDIVQVQSVESTVGEPLQAQGAAHSLTLNYFRTDVNRRSVSGRSSSIKLVPGDTVTVTFTSDVEITENLRFYSKDSRSFTKLLHQTDAKRVPAGSSVQWTWTVPEVYDSRGNLVSIALNPTVAWGTDTTLTFETASLPQINLTLSGNGGTPETCLSKMCDMNSTVGFTGMRFPEREGYNFHGWNTERGATGDHYNWNDSVTLGMYALTLYAEWFHQVSFEGGAFGTPTLWYIDSYYDNEGNIGKWAAYDYDENPILSANTGEVEASISPNQGYAILGWTADENSLEPEFAPTFTVSKESLRGPFEKDNSVYYAIGSGPVTLSYDGDCLDSDGHWHETGVSPEDQVAGDVTRNAGGATDGRSVTFTVADKGDMACEGYVFVGWNTEWDWSGDTYLPGDEITLSDDTMLCAMWVSEEDIFPVIYNVNGGTSDTAPAEQQKVKGVDLVLHSGQPSRAPDSVDVTTTLNYNDGETENSWLKTTRSESWVFAGWNTEAGGTGTTYQPGDTYGGDAALQLFAQWQGQDVTYSSTALPTPERDGYEFLGWATIPDTDGKTKGIDYELYEGGASYTPEADSTLYAQWLGDTYEITYDANGGDSAPSAQTKAHGRALTLTNQPATRQNVETAVTLTLNYKGGSYKSGDDDAFGTSHDSATSTITTAYTFKGWGASASATEAAYQPGGTYPADENADATLYAVWDSETTGYKTYKLPEAQLNNHEFKGWATTPGATESEYAAGVDFSPTADTTLYAVWNPPVYTITYDGNAGSDKVENVPAAQYKVGTGAVTLSSAKPTREPAKDEYTVSFEAHGGSECADLAAANNVQYEFKEWCTTADGTGDNYNPGDSYAKNDFATLYAQWTKSGSVAAITLPTPTRDGYAFAGWCTVATPSAGDGSTLYAGGDTYTPEEDSTLYAQWKPDTYDVTYDANGGEGAPDDQVKTHDMDLTLSSGEPTRDDATDSYDVTYDANGGSAARASDTVAVTTTYAFQGWAEVATVGAEQGIVTDAEWAAYDATKKHAAGSAYTANADLDLFAQWKETVSDDPDTLTLPAADRPGYTFLGWYDAASGGNKVGDAGSTYTPSGAATLHAQWKPYEYPGESFAYTVVFESPEGTQVATQQFTFGVSQALDAGTLTAPEGKVFAGWRLKGGSTTFTEHQLVSNLTNDADGMVYLVATWKDAPSGGSGGSDDDYTTYKVEYYEQGTDGETYAMQSSDTIVEDAGENVEVPASSLDAPLGFHVDLDETVQAGVVASDNSTTLKVYWARNQFDVTFEPGATDATGTMDDQHFVWASGDTLNANQFARSGWKFDGWKVTEKDGVMSTQSLGLLTVQAMVLPAARLFAPASLSTQAAVDDSVADQAEGSHLTWTDSGHVTLTAQWVESSSDNGNDNGGDNPPGGDDDKPSGGDDKPSGGHDDNPNKPSGGDDQKPSGGDDDNSGDDKPGNGADDGDNGSDSGKKADDDDSGKGKDKDASGKNGANGKKSDASSASRTATTGDSPLFAYAALSTALLAAGIFLLATRRRTHGQD